jgi:hypothetical protein
VTITAELRFITAEADTLALAALVAFTVTVCEPLIEAGAVYRPAAEMLPTAGLIDQFTAVLLVPKTVAANC